MMMLRIMMVTRMSMTAMATAVPKARRVDNVTVIVTSDYPSMMISFNS